MGKRTNSLLKMLGLERSRSPTVSPVIVSTKPTMRNNSPLSKFNVWSWCVVVFFVLLAEIICMAVVKPEDGNYSKFLEDMRIGVGVVSSVGFLVLFFLGVKAYLGSYLDRPLMAMILLNYVMIASVFGVLYSNEYIKYIVFRDSNIMMPAIPTMDMGAAVMAPASDVVDLSAVGMPTIIDATCGATPPEYFGVKMAFDMFIDNQKKYNRNDIGGTTVTDGIRKIKDDPSYNLDFFKYVLCMVNKDYKTAYFYDNMVIVLDEVIKSRS